MQCNEVKNQLGQHQGDSERLAGDAKTHLTDCDDCRMYAEDLRLASLLNSLPVPKIREGFAAQALEKAWLDGGEGSARSQLKLGSMLAIAASLLLTIGVMFQLPWSGKDSLVGESPIQTVNVVPGRVQSVNFLMVSAEALPDAQITLRMDSNVNLAGYADRRELSWAAPMIAGNNQLTLPVQLQGNSSGNIVLEVESGGLQKELVVTVDAREIQRASLLLI